MPTLSVCMIVKNEAKVLARCLKCAAKFANELIIVDTGSEDNTKQIAKTFTENVYDYKWNNDFAAARNFSFSKATSDYIMWLDADDVVTDENVEKILALKRELAKIDVAMIKYILDSDLDGNPTFSFFRERIFKRANNFVWEGAVHEAVSYNGKVKYFDIAIHHKKLHIANPKRNLEIYESLKSSGHIFSPREQYYYAKELYYTGDFDNSKKALLAFLDMNSGFIENKIDACRYLSFCYLKTNDFNLALKSLLQSLSYGLPKAEIACDIANIFLTLLDINSAIFWYKIALNTKKQLTKNAFIEDDYYDYIPLLQLCVCYDKLKNYKKASSYNQKAKIVKPNSEACKLNEEYFNKIFACVNKPLKSI